jgi:FkbH-like protein
MMQFAEKHPNIFVLDTATWFDSPGAATDFRSYYLSKSLYTLPVYANAATDISAALAGLRGRTKKLIALDLDDTLWGGIVGDEGWENLKLGGHDAVGESLADFQRALKRLKGRGILLALVSKNEESIALQAIENNPGMQLSKSDFAGWRINWEDKASNLVQLAEELNIGLDSIVFIDDNPAERARVREALPEVTVPEWPTNPMNFSTTLASLPLFDVPRVTPEDRQRTLSYQAEVQRKLLHQKVDSLEGWLKSLDIVVEIETLSSRNLQRAEQLFNKTNQFNLSTRRLSRGELESWGQGENRKVWCFTVRDRFGDSGIVGLVGVEWEGSECTITDFILSCRVFGRKVERVMLATVLDFAGQSGKGVTARYRATPKNHPTLKFLKESGLNEIESNAVFTWPKGSSYRFPEGIKVVRA